MPIDCNTLDFLYVSYYEDGVCKKTESVIVLVQDCRVLRWV